MRRRALPNRSSKEPVEVASLPESSPSKPKLTSVMKRRGQAEPTLAAPPTPPQALAQFSIHRTVPHPVHRNANSGTGQIIRPLQVFPTPADADFVAELATPVNGAPELASPAKDLTGIIATTALSRCFPRKMSKTPHRNQKHLDWQISPQLHRDVANSSSNLNVQSLPGETPSGQASYDTQNLPTQSAIPSQPMRSESFNQLAIPVQDLTSPGAPRRRHEIVASSSGRVEKRSNAWSRVGSRSWRRITPVARCAWSGGRIDVQSQPRACRQDARTNEDSRWATGDVPYHRIQQRRLGSGRCGGGRQCAQLG